MTDFRSKLANDITEEFQKVCDKRDLVAVELQKLRKEVVMRELNTCLIKVEKIVLSHLQLPITLVNVDGCRGGFISINTDSKGTGGLDKYVTERFYHKNTTKPKTANEFIKISENTKKDFTSFEGVDDDVAKHFEFKLMCDFSGFFCAKSEWSLMVDDYTAEECTAILLHEMGHAISMTKRLGSTKYNFVCQKEHFNYFLNNSSGEEKKKLADYYLKVERKKNNPDKDVVLTLDSIPRELLEASEKDKTDASLPVSVLVTIMMVWYSLLTIPFYYFMGIVVELIFDIVGPIIKHEYDKTDDLPTTHRSLALLEIEADEFVARHGFAVHLTTALIKLKKTPFLAEAATSNSKLLYYTDLLLCFVGNTFIVPHLEGAFTDYENLDTRVQTMRLNTIKNLKNSTMSKEALTMYIDSIDKMEKQLKATNSMFVLGNLYGKLFRFVKNFVSPGKLYEIIIRGAWPKDVEDLMYDIEKLKNNDLYVSVARLKTLI